MVVLGGGVVSYGRGTPGDQRSSRVGLCSNLFLSQSFSLELRLVADELRLVARGRRPLTTELACHFPVTRLNISWRIYHMAGDWEQAVESSESRMLRGDTQGEQGEQGVASRVLPTCDRHLASEVGGAGLEGTLHRG